MNDTINDNLPLEIDEKNLSEEKFNDVLERVTEMLRNGSTLGEMRGLTENEMELIYSIAYNLYQQSKYQDAEKIFKFLVLYGHLDKRFWMGLGACHQELKQYQQAIDAYSYIAILDVNDPDPPLQAAICHLALNDQEKAWSGLQAAIHWSSDKPQYALTRQRAELLLESMNYKTG